MAERVIRFSEDRDLFLLFVDAELVASCTSQEALYAARRLFCLSREPNDSAINFVPWGKGRDAEIHALDFRDDVTTMIGGHRSNVNPMDLN